jgi:hypothetical protein
MVGLLVYGARFSFVPIGLRARRRARLRCLIGSEDFLSSPLVVLGKRLKSIGYRLIRRVLRNASQGLRSIVVFLAQHIVSYPDALNMHVDAASAALTRAGIKYD